MSDRNADVRAQVRAASLSVASNTGLVLLKLGVGVTSGSVAVLSEAAHSGLDLIAALTALAAVRVASRPPDRNHPFGHGKVQHLAALAEGLLVLAAGLWILVQAVAALRSGQGPAVTGPGIAVMALSAAVNTVVSRHLRIVARRTGSSALEADAVHLSTDVVSSLGVLAALGFVHITGLVVFDALAAAAVVAVIFTAGLRLLRGATLALTDARLEEHEERAILEAVAAFRHRFVEVHSLRSRRVGSRPHVDFHLVVHRQSPIEEVHALCDDLEAAIRRRLAGADVVIHPEPCDHRCVQCDLGAKRR